MGRSTQGTQPVPGPLCPASGKIPENRLLSTESVFGKPVFAPLIPRPLLPPGGEGEQSAGFLLAPLRERGARVRGFPYTL